MDTTNQITTDKTQTAGTPGSADGHISQTTITPDASANPANPAHPAPAPRTPRTQRTPSLAELHDATRTLVMGVLNITQDSFSDGGLWLDPTAAANHGLAMMRDGADIIDIGAESTRPGAQRVDENTEKTRVLGAVRALLPHGAVLSIDTTRATVAQAALDAGAQIINDVSGGQLDPDMPRVIRDNDCLYILQHWRGWLAGSKTGAPDQNTSVYEHGVLTDVIDEIRRQLDAVLEAGVDPSRIILDPGLGFSKPTPDDNLPLLAGLDRLQALGYPVLIGQSRKRFIGAMLAELPWSEAGEGAAQDDKDNATAALSALCAEHGAWAVRVHDVRRTVAAVCMGTAWRDAARALA